MKVFKKLAVAILSLFTIGAACSVAGCNKKGVQKVLYYESTVQFYVNPEKSNGSEDNVDSDYGVYGGYADYVMDNMIKILNEDAFMETLSIELSEDNQLQESLRNKVKESLHFTYKISSLEENPSLTRSFICANISVLGTMGIDFAMDLYDVVKELVPEYVVEHMAIPKGYQSTNCSRISRNDEPKMILK